MKNKNKKRALKSKPINPLDPTGSWEPEDEDEEEEVALPEPTTWRAADEALLEDIRNKQLAKLGQDTSPVTMDPIPVPTTEIPVPVPTTVIPAPEEPTSKTVTLTEVANDMVMDWNDMLGSIQNNFANAFRNMYKVGNLEPVLPKEDEIIWTNEELERQEKFSNICLEAENLFMRKNREYGNAIKYTGAVGSLVAMTGDVARLRQMLLYKLDSIDLIDTDNIRDKFIDVLVQAVIGIMMMDADNIMGEE